MEVNILTECPCPCFEPMKLLQKRVTSLELQVKMYNQVLIDYDKIKEELLVESKRHSSGWESDRNLSTLSNARDQQKPDLQGPNRNLTEYADKLQEPDYKRSRLGGDSSNNDSTDDTTHVTLSLASTPKLVMDNSTGSAKSSSMTTGSEPNFSGNFYSGNMPSGLISVVNYQSQSKSNDDNWQSLDQPLDYSLNKMSRPKEIFQQEMQTEPENKRRKKAAGKAENSTDLLLNSLLVCPECNTGFAFKKILHLKRHFRRFHSGDQEVYPCEYCKQTFVYKERLATHVSATHKGIRYKCEMPGCTSVFTRESDLRRHQKRSVHIGFKKIRVNVHGTNVIN